MIKNIWKNTCKHVKELWEEPEKYIVLLGSIVIIVLLVSSVLAATVAMP